MLTPDKVHKKYGITEVYPKTGKINVADKQQKKYMIDVYDNEGKKQKIYFGDSRYEQYKDKIGEYSIVNHLDNERREKYLARASKIKDKEGNLTANNPLSPNFYSIRLLW